MWTDIIWFGQRPFPFPFPCHSHAHTSHFTLLPHFQNAYRIDCPLSPSHVRSTLYTLHSTPHQTLQSTDSPLLAHYHLHTVQYNHHDWDTALALLLVRFLERERFTRFFSLYTLSDFRILDEVEDGIDVDVDVDVDVDIAANGETVDADADADADVDVVEFWRDPETARARPYA